MTIATRFLLAPGLIGLIAAACPGHADEPAVAVGFRSGWHTLPDRTWVGPEFWANRLQDWAVRGGRLECVPPRTLAMRTVHLLTHRLADRFGPFEMSVHLGLANPEDKVPAASAAGFLIGAGGREMDYRSAVLVQQFGGAGGGLFAGVDAEGRVFFQDSETRGAERKPAGAAAGKPVDVVLRLSAAHVAKDGHRLRLSSHHPKTDQTLSEASLVVSGAQVVGGVALVSHGGTAGGPKDKTDSIQGRFWFRDWVLKGEKVEPHPDRLLGPIICAQYTLSRGVLKLTAQLMPLGDQENDEVRLEVKEDTGWKTIAKTKVIKPGYTAPFRIAKWDSTRDHEYRVAYEMKVGDKARSVYWKGTIRRDPVDKPVITLAAFSCNHNNAHGLTSWKDGVWFPHADLTRQVVKQKPDLLFFAGDQIYEGASPTFPDRDHLELDYLYKWYLWCWAYRDLARDTPCITIPDDHDVYQGNLWGEGGRKAKVDNEGGYVHPSEFVKMVERTQTSHLPDPFDPTPVAQGISVYYTDLVWGRVGFAILEDRKFKSGCGGGRLPATGTKRPDHINDPTFDVRKADVPGLQLLGERQVKFLRHWTADWRGADLKAALSQTHFANMATHHGPNLQYLIADLDANGWPQRGRNQALDELRRGFAVHVCGDQHLSTVVRHGIDAHRDAGYAFCVPATANFYPRKWEPKAEGANRPAGAPAWMGDHFDGLKNRVTVLAAANPGAKTGREPAALHDKMPGYGIIQFNKPERTITFECWPRYADPAKDKQYDGWPITIKQTDNDGRKPVAYLPTLDVAGLDNPVVQVIAEPGGEVLYALRVKGRGFRAPVFAEGKYTVQVGDPDTGKLKTLKGVQALPADKKETLKVVFD